MPINSIADLYQLKNRSAFDDIDLEFASFLQRLSLQDNPVLALTAALVSCALRQNHICMRLDDYAGEKWPFEYEANPLEEPLFIQLPTLSYWKKELKKFPHYVSFNDEIKPLIVDAKNRVYIQRYFKYEQSLAEFLIRKIAQNKSSYFESRQNISQLSEYFQKNDKIDYQQVAVFASLINHLSVITGAPGTGKTTVVATILAAHYQENPNTKIGICAPTGKAAARLKEAINNELENLNTHETVKNKISKIETSTIHRLLKTKYNTPHFFYNKENKLKIDLLIIDEASMVSQPLMCKLFDALPDSAKLVMLGDKDQLASVEEGSVFGDICDTLPINQFSHKFVDNLKKHSLQKSLTATNSESPDAIIELNKSYRFDDSEGIGLAKTAINEKDFNKVLAIGKVHNERFLLRSLPGKNFIKNQILNYLNSLRIEINDKELSIKDYFNLTDISPKFDFINKFRILCAKRNGIYGVNNINRLILEHFFGPQARYSDGMPVMITVNDHRLKLYNGDVGIVRQEGKSQKVYFPDSKKRGEFRNYTPNQLPEHEAVFAMTVHKSQGSGFQKILIIMPDKDSRLLTRELLYTAITRAEKYCEIWSYDSIIKKCISRKTERDSGLKDKLTIFSQP